MKIKHIYEKIHHILTFRLKNIRILQDTTPLRYFFQKLTLKGEKRIAKLVCVFGGFALYTTSSNLRLNRIIFCRIQFYFHPVHILPHFSL